MAEIINKIATSGLQTLNLEEYYLPGERVVFDLRPYLFQELILKEKEFREFVKTNDWSAYTNKHVAITCSADAIVPTWAYMLLSTALSAYAAGVYFGSLPQMEEFLFVESISKINVEEFRNKKVVVKGCGDIPVPTNAFVMVSRLLRPVAKSIMYGEPCSTVPIYKSK